MIGRKVASLSLLLWATAAAAACDILVEAENFANKGGWVVDQQFMDLMGSPYLLAHGAGQPVADATTTVEVEMAGLYHVYVRTYNWTSPWHNGEGPGKFRLSVDGKPMEVAGCAGDRWMWQPVGECQLDKGETTLTLTDITGFDGRCDAIFITDNAASDPRSLTDDEILRLRRLAAGYDDSAAADSAAYDFVVVGGGVAGMCAAAAASRLGVKVALVNDRPVLGGNNSSEVRVHLGGIIETGRYEGLGRMIREFGHSRKGNAQPADNYEDEKKAEFIAGEENVTLYAPYRAVSVEMDGNKIASTLLRHIETGHEIVLTAPIFADCTGDGNLGVMAGAHYRMGRESSDEYFESLAPEEADSIVMGASVQWYSVLDDQPQDFPEFSYGLDFNQDNAERVLMGEWTWETGMNRDQITEAEQIRDYGLMVIYSNWSFLKNHLADNAQYRNRRLEWVAYVAGKRESRRLLGDYVLKQDDIAKDVAHEDASFTTTWSVDLHFADPDNSAKFPGGEFKTATVHRWIHPYSVPYRCLYSRNVDNLFMAGRCISVTHVALGTVRVMRTTGMMGEVVGIAASICKKYCATPREIYWHHLDELKHWMTLGLGAYDAPDNQHFNLPNVTLPEATGTVE